MSITAVPISIERVRAPTAASSGNGEPSWRAKWWTRKYAPSAPSSSAATARSMDCRSVSAAERVRDWGEGDQCPNERKPIFFMRVVYTSLVRDHRAVGHRVAPGTSDVVGEVTVLSLECARI